MADDGWILIKCMTPVHEVFHEVLHQVGLVAANGSVEK